MRARAQVRVSAESFVINQFGLAAFAPAAGGGGGWEARTFNFNLFPRTFWPVEKVFTCEAGSLEYLAKHNFDFNKMVYKGIPFMPLATQDRLLRVRTHTRVATLAHVVYKGRLWCGRAGIGVQGPGVRRHVSART